MAWPGISLGKSATREEHCAIFELIITFHESGFMMVYYLDGLTARTW